MYTWVWGKTSKFSPHRLILQGTQARPFAVSQHLAAHVAVPLHVVLHKKQTFSLGECQILPLLWLEKRVEVCCVFGVHVHRLTFWEMGFFFVHFIAYCYLWQRHRFLQGGKAPYLSGAGTCRKSKVPVSQVRSLRPSLQGAEGYSSADCLILDASHSASPLYCGYSLTAQES